MDGSSVDEIADGIYRISTWLPGAVGGRGLTINRFLVLAEEPLLFHTGRRADLADTLVAIDRLVPLERLRWLSFGHVEADECGAMNELLAVAPALEVAFGELGCALSVDDLADRPPRRLAPGEAIDLGGRRVAVIPTPHAPHNQEAQVLFEETTGTLLCGDLFTQLGAGPAVTTACLVEQALEAEKALAAASPGGAVPMALDRLADLEPRTLAVMHGSSFEGDGATELRELASAWRARVSSPGAEPLACGRPAG
jgi:flavorubredoxin